VYVTANPQFHKIREELDCEFHAVIDCWWEDWDDAVQTVRPETTTSAALKAAAEYPEKRLFVHFNQPHVPFIGESGAETFDIEEIHRSSTAVLATADGGGMGRLRRGDLGRVQ